MLQVNEWIVEEAAKAEAEADESIQDDEDSDDPDDGQITMQVGNALTLPKESSTAPAKSKSKRQKNKRSSSKAMKTDPEVSTSVNKGKLILDATCAPADIKYPTDLCLLHAREILEGFIDTLHEPRIGQMTKPRTYRNQARKAYLSVTKQRRTCGKTIRKAIRIQLSYVHRNLSIIATQAADTALTKLSHRQLRRLLVISELYRQQREMFEQRKHVIEDRIVSIDQPHVRPIVRGKAGASVEFGAKIAASLVSDYAHIESMNWDNFNEAKTLKQRMRNQASFDGERVGSFHCLDQ